MAATLQGCPLKKPHIKNIRSVEGLKEVHKKDCRIRDYINTEFDKTGKCIDCFSLLYQTLFLYSL